MYFWNNNPEKVVYTEIFRFDGPRSNRHKVLLFSISAARHHTAAFCSDIVPVNPNLHFFSFPIPERQKLLLIDDSICGTSDAVAVDWSNPVCSDASHSEVALLSWWRSLEMRKEHNQATAKPTLKYTDNFTHSSFFGGGDIICSDIWCWCHVAIMTVIQACHC